MNGSKKHALLFPTVIAVLLFGATTLPAASDWKVIKVGNREYLSVDNIAQFYGFPPDAPRIGKTIRLDNGKNSMQFTLDSREAIVNGVRNWLSFPVTEREGKFLVSRVDLAKSIEPQLRPQMIANLGKLQTVVLDPGHGGHDKGALSSYGCEKDYALDVARQLKPLLEAKGLKVIMTRDSDVFIPLELRARIANSTRDSIFVSLHFNATDMNPTATGFEIFSLTPRGSPSTQDDGLALRFLNMQAGSPVDAPSLALSTSIYHSVLGHLPEFDRGIKRARFAVLRLTKVPAVLVEGGFLTERGESRLIADSMWRAKLAQSISTGIGNYRDLVEKKRRPMLVADYRREQLGGELIAWDANQPALEGVAAASVIIPTSNARRAPATTYSPDQPAARHSETAQSETEQVETEQGMNTPEVAQTFETKYDSPAAADEPKIEVPTRLEPGAENVVSTSLASVPVATPRDIPAPLRSEAVASTKLPPSKRYWFLGPFPKFLP